MSEQLEQLAREAAIKLVFVLPPDVLEHPLPFPVRLDYARKIAAKHFTVFAQSATADLRREVEEKTELVAKYETRLCIDPGGGDKIDELNSAMCYLRAEMDGLKDCKDTCGGECLRCAQTTAEQMFASYKELKADNDRLRKAAEYLWSNNTREYSRETVEWITAVLKPK